MNCIRNFLCRWSSRGFHHGHKSFVLKHITSVEFLAFRPKSSLDGALLCFFWREYIWAVSRRKWGHPYSKHDSQNVWQQSMFGHFLPPLSPVFEEDSQQALGLFCRHPWCFLCKSAKINILPTPVSLFPCPFPSHTPGYFQGIPVLIWLVLLVFTHFHSLLCEVRTESSPSSINLEDSNLAFQGHLHSEPMGT